MAEIMGMMNLYREELKAMARSLDQEGLSQTAISKELGVSKMTIHRWLNGDACDQTGNNSLLSPSVSHNVTLRSSAPHYLVVCQAVEKFCPPDGITFPVIIADPPWNVSDPGHKRERKVRPRPFTKDFEHISPNAVSGCRTFMRWRLRTLGYSSGAHIAIFPRFSPRLSVQGGRITPSTSGTRPIPCPCSATITSCSV